MRRLLLPALTTLLFTVAASFVPLKTSKHFRIEQVAPGIWAAINNDNYGHAICNAGIIDLGDKTIIFDPFMNIDAAKNLKAVARQLTKRDASIVINSHFHNDHVRGNQVFLPASIVSTGWTRDEMAISEPQELEWEKKNAASLVAKTRESFKTATAKEKEELVLWLGYYEAMLTQSPLVKTTLPNVTFNDSLWIHGSARSIVLREFKNGHTASDVVLIAPKEGVAFMGDLFFEKRHPYLAQGNPDSAVKILKTVFDDPSLNKYVPGHGDVAGKNEIKEMSNYIHELKNLVWSGIQQQQADSTIKMNKVPATFTNWKFGRFFGANVNGMIKHLRSAAK